jgi:IS5 family transposase
MAMREVQRKLDADKAAVAAGGAHTKADHRMDRCWLQGAVGDALHALCCAAGYNIRWLLRAIARLGLGALFCAWSAVVVYVVVLLGTLLAAPKAARATVRPPSVRSQAFTSIRLAVAV